MYDWLSDALQGSATVVTANRRLARVLQQAYAAQQLSDGQTAWPTPAIVALHDWLDDVVYAAADQSSLPTRLNHNQSRLLWERCLSKEFADTEAGISNLVRLSRDAWQRLADWRISIQELAQSVQNDDQRLFASVAGRYLGILERSNWVDDAGLGGLACELIDAGRVPVSGQYTFAGFDRLSPIVVSLKGALADRKCSVQSVAPRDTRHHAQLASFENSEAEFRAAGAWAREQLLKGADRKVAIIANNLEQQAQQKTRLVREGLLPGWQYSGAEIPRAVNVSYGRKLVDYPAVSVALLLLRWLVRDQGATAVGHLLRSPLLATGGMGGRSRMELRLRRLPDRNWSPAMISAALHSESGDAQGWNKLVAAMSKWRREMPKSASPAAWALYVDEVLKTCHWPGDSAQTSYDFQLVNRWRDLLNELARLDLVSPSMTFASALQRLEQMAQDTVFQPESPGAAVQLLGPLEAAGAEFDALWITGLSASHWPPAGRPSALISRRLQRQKGMPDAEPSDTLEYAENMLRRLGQSAAELVYSYPLSEDDAEQTPSDLLRIQEHELTDSFADPGLHASRLAETQDPVAVRDAVPAVMPDELVAGGAGTIQRHLREPIAAFVTGRLGVRSLQVQATGVSPSMRGNIVHDALYQLYVDKPTRAQISSWTPGELHQRIEQAISYAFGRHERNTDAVLFEVLRLERQRVERLLRHFVGVDAVREEFEIASVEQQVDFSESAVRLQLRVDRIDRMPDGSLAILDYKTGAKRNFLQTDGQPAEIQLVAYANALDEPVSALALVFIDSRELTFSGAGRAYTDEAEWPEMLKRWQQLVRDACDEMSQGDVRVNALQGTKDARYLNLLSRYTELRRDG